MHQPTPTPGKKLEKPKGTASPLLLFLQIVISLLIFSVVLWQRGPLSKALQETAAVKHSKFIPASQGAWRFIVSGDSRNCGDIVMPAIAAQGIARYQPEFYWHLGDLRAIYKIDEDMAGAAQKAGQHLSCDSYQKNAWQDFIDHQIVPFGTTRFYLGVGNHEVIPPKTVAEFSSTFQDWLLTPHLLMQGQEKQGIASATSGACQKIASRPYLTATPYYHWIRSEVDFIYLDNSSGVFQGEQLDWFDCILERAQNNKAIKTVVVGMHEALPSSRASDHAMCDAAIKDPVQKKQSCDSGNHIYDALVEFKKTKHVYVLASHSHFFMKGIFDNQQQANRLDGWIVGTAGAVRYSLPQGTSPGPDALADHYGYLLGTVLDGTIEFNFNEVTESDLPQDVRRQYSDNVISWCFAKNSRNLNPDSEETTNRCNTVLPPALPAAPWKK
ncbi:MAG: hypothetical protein ACRD3B_13650 [Candidatus Sulfotelmatobacter sp.]